MENHRTYTTSIDDNGMDNWYCLQVMNRMIFCNTIAIWISIVSLMITISSVVLMFIIWKS